MTCRFPVSRIVVAVILGIVGGSCYGEGPCDTAALSLPTGTAPIDDAHGNALVGGTVDVDEGSVTFRYTDSNGDSWVIVYSLQS
jgi:hypothetical protein